MCHGDHDEDMACKPLPRDNSVSGVFEAKYYSKCSGDCGDKISPGEEVVFRADRLMHVECS